MGYGGNTRNCGSSEEQLWKTNSWSPVDYCIQEGQSFSIHSSLLDYPLDDTAAQYLVMVIENGGLATGCRAYAICENEYAVRKVCRRRLGGRTDFCKDISRWRCH